jgi:hypothetical protein
LVGLPDIEVEGLSPVEARARFDSVIPGRFDEEVRSRIVFEAEGNPVAIAELLLSRVRPGTITGDFGPPSAMPLLPAVIEKSVRDRLDGFRKGLARRKYGRVERGITAEP